MEEKLRPGVFSSYTAGSSGYGSGSRAAGLALAGFDPNVLDERDVHYQCDCSAERTKEMLFSLGRKELVRMRDEDPACEVVCHFCHSKYQYDLNDLLAEYDAQAAERAAAEQGT